MSNLPDTEEREGELLPCGHPMTRFRTVSQSMSPIGRPRTPIPYGELPATVWCTSGCGWLKVTDGDFDHLTTGGYA
jgi:hypothetical protein